MKYKVHDKEFENLKEAVAYKNEIDWNINRFQMFNPEKRIDTTIKGYRFGDGRIQP